jgi:hypothetical protein
MRCAGARLRQARISAATASRRFFAELCGPGYPPGARIVDDRRRTVRLGIAMRPSLLPWVHFQSCAPVAA